MRLRRIELEVELIEWVRFLRIALGRTSPMGAATKACGHRGGSVWGRLYREDGTLAGARWVRWVLRPACPGSPLPLASTAWSFTGLTGYLAKDGSGFAGRATKKVGCSRPMTSALSRHPPCGTRSQAENKRPFKRREGSGLARPCFLSHAHIMAEIGPAVNWPTLDSSLTSCKLYVKGREQ